MRIAWLECATGISGDMTLAALIDAGVDRNQIRRAIDSLGLPDVTLRVETIIRNGFRATQVLVDHPEQHAHRHFSDVCRIIDQSSVLTGRQKSSARELFRCVAEAEARVHGSTVDKVHFHEVGAIDSIVDIVGVAVAFDLLNVERIICHPIPPGRGFVKIDHGICPVPAPGTAEILKGVPLADIPINAELTTPTGAAIVKTLADGFGPMPAMTIDQIGSGAGTMSFPERANVLRIFVGTATIESNAEYVCLLETNLDDVSGETIGHVRERLATAGALDVFVIPMQMKKDRPGQLLSVLCRPESAARMEDILFDETGTLGVRRQLVERRTQSRDIVTVPTVWGPVSGKRSWRTGTTPAFSPEFEDCARVARAAGVALRDVVRAAEFAYQQTEKSDTLSDTRSGQDSAESHSHDHHSHDDHHHDHDHHSHDSHSHDGHRHDHDHRHDDHHHDHNA